MDLILIKVTVLFTVIYFANFLPVPPRSVYNLTKPYVYGYAAPEEYIKLDNSEKSRRIVVTTESQDNSFDDNGRVVKRTASTDVIQTVALDTEDASRNVSTTTSFGAYSTKEDNQTYPESPSLTEFILNSTTAATPVKVTNSLHSYDTEVGITANTMRTKTFGSTVLQKATTLPTADNTTTIATNVGGTTFGSLTAVQATMRGTSSTGAATVLRESTKDTTMDSLGISLSTDGITANDVSSVATGTSTAASTKEGIQLSNTTFPSEPENNTAHSVVTETTAYMPTYSAFPEQAMTTSPVTTEYSTLSNNTLTSQTGNTGAPFVATEESTDNLTNQTTPGEETTIYSVTTEDTALNSTTVTSVAENSTTIFVGSEMSTHKFLMTHSETNLDSTFSTSDAENSTTPFVATEESTDNLTNQTTPGEETTIYSVTTEDTALNSTTVTSVAENSTIIFVGSEMSTHNFLNLTTPGEATTTYSVTTEETTLNSMTSTSGAEKSTTSYVATGLSTHNLNNQTSPEEATMTHSVTTEDSILNSTTSTSSEENRTTAATGGEATLSPSVTTEHSKLSKTTLTYQAVNINTPAVGPQLSTHKTTSSTTPVDATTTASLAPEYTTLRNANLTFLAEKSTTPAVGTEESIHNITSFTTPWSTTRLMTSEVSRLGNASITSDLIHVGNTITFAGESQVTPSMPSTVGVTTDKADSVASSKGTEVSSLTAGMTTAQGITSILIGTGTTMSSNTSVETKNNGSLVTVAPNIHPNGSLNATRVCNKVAMTLISVRCGIGAVWNPNEGKCEPSNVQLDGRVTKGGCGLLDQDDKNQGLTFPLESMEEVMYEVISPYCGIGYDFDYKDKKCKTKA